MKRTGNEWSAPRPLWRSLATMAQCRRRACKRGCKARCCGRHSCSNPTVITGVALGTLPDVPTQCPVNANLVGPDVAALSSACVCDRKVRHRERLAMRFTPSACAPDAEDFGRAGCEQACSGQAPSGQQCALWCSCDLAGAARARALAAWDMVEHAWYELTGGWTAVCDRLVAPAGRAGHHGLGKKVCCCNSA